VHSLVLCFKCKDIFRALRPWFAIVWVDMCHNVANAVFVMTDCFRAAVEIAGAVVLSIEVFFPFEGVVAVERDDELDAVSSRFVHEIIKAVQNFIVPGLGSAALEVGIAVYRGSFLWI
jgi:hypothetical protein